jgi:CRISPR-associated protein Cmr1
MSRKPPEDLNHNKLLPPEVTKQSDSLERTMTIGTEKTTVIVQTRQYKLITPLFGGGVEPGVNDPDNLIRGTEIRGQLRFWWRAIRGWKYKNLKELKSAEDIMWGKAGDLKEEEGAKHPDARIWKMPVQIEVEVNGKGNDVEAFFVKEDERTGNIQIKPTHNVPEYVAFSLQPEREEINKASKALDIQLKTVRENVSFTLTISFIEEWEEDMLATLWAWETFGGIGARTRRGFGAIQLENNGQSEMPPTNELDTENWIRDHLTYWGANNSFPEHIPHLSPTMLLYILDPATKPASIWNMLIEKLKKFRQQRDLYKDKNGKMKTGPNKWPEAEAIRKSIPGQPLKGNDPNPPDKFPRAVFGLPIVFHFLKEPRADNTILQGNDKKHERLSSPLILRPLGCGKNEALGLAAVFEGWELPPDGLTLISKKNVSSVVESSQTKLNTSEVKKLGLKWISGEEKDALHAFMNYLKGRR